jgi:putative heme-binding domain-containing protein
MPGNWFLSDREIWQVVRYVRSLGRAATEVIPGDPDKGKLVFERAQCTKCHIVDGRGGTSGPELSGIADRRGLEALREAVVFPEKQLPLDASGYQAYRVVLLATTEGRLLTGLRINEDTFTIQLRDDASQLHSLRKHELNELRKTEGSWMPSYEKLLSSTEIEDLVSFLARLKGKP